jgi:hypothetical protein
MKPNGFTRGVKKLGGVISKNSPTILTGLAVGGLFTTVIFAVQATPKAQALLNEELENRGLSAVGEYHSDKKFSDDFTKTEIVKITWKVYIPAACMGLATAACIVGSNSINQRRNAALATVYGLTEAAFREYKEKVVETIGKSKELKVRDEISGDHVKNISEDCEVVLTGRGNILCLDSFGRLFRSDIEDIRRSINNVNQDFIDDRWISLNDWYYAIGLSETKYGDNMGWDLDEGLMDVSFSSQLTEKNEPCLVLNYKITPKFLK